MAGIAPPPMGLQEAFGVGRESSYGSAATPGIWWKADPMTITRQDPHLAVSGPSGSMVQHRYHATRPRKFRGTPQVRGNVVVACEFDDLGHLLGNAIAPPSVSGPTDSAYTHTFALTAAKPANMPTSLTVARLTGLEDLQYVGCMIDNFQLNCTPGQILSASMDFIGQTGGAAEAADTDTEGYSTAPWMEFHHVNVRYHATPNTATGSLATLASGSEAMGATFRLENRLRAVQAAGNNVRGIREPVWNDYRMATLSFDRDMFDDDFFDEYHSATEAAAFSTVELRVLGTENIGAGTTPFQMRIYMPFALIDLPGGGYSGGAGPIPETVTFTAGTDGTENPVTVTLVNGTTSFTA